MASGHILIWVVLGVGFLAMTALVVAISGGSRWCSNAVRTALLRAGMWCALVYVLLAMVLMVDWILARK